MGATCRRDLQKLTTTALPTLASSNWPSEGTTMVRHSTECEWLFDGKYDWQLAHLLC